MSRTRDTDEVHPFLWIFAFAGLLRLPWLSEANKPGFPYVNHLEVRVHEHAASLPPPPPDGVLVSSLIRLSLSPPSSLSPLPQPNPCTRARDTTPINTHRTTRVNIRLICPPGALRPPRLRGVQAAATGRAELCPVCGVPRRDGPAAAAAGAEAGQARHRAGGAATSLLHQARAEAVRPVGAGAAHPGGAQAQGET